MNTILNFINEKETELRELIESLVIARLNEEARNFRQSNSWSTIYIDREDGSLHVYEWTEQGSRPADYNLRALIAIDEDIATWGEENTFMDYLNIWFEMETPADIDEEEWAEKYPAEFEDYVNEGVNYFMACFDIDGIIADIKEDVLEDFE